MKKSILAILFTVIAGAVNAADLLLQPGDSTTLNISCAEGNSCPPPVVDDFYAHGGGHSSLQIDCRSCHGGDLRGTDASIANRVTRTCIAPSGTFRLPDNVSSTSRTVTVAPESVPRNVVGTNIARIELGDKIGCFMCHNRVIFKTEDGTEVIGKFNGSTGATEYVVETLQISDGSGGDPDDGNGGTEPPPASGPVSVALSTPSIPKAPEGTIGDWASPADDPAIWIASNPLNSRIIGTDKYRGLWVYDLAGNIVQQLTSEGETDNVDVRYNFTFDDGIGDIVAASNRSDNTIRIYKVSSGGVLSKKLVFTAGNTLYGICSYKNYVFGTSKDGKVEQWQITSDEDGVYSSLVRSFDVGNVTEGCVADDESEVVFFAEEDVALWRYGANPEDGSSRTRVDSVGSNGLQADLEGVTIYNRPNGEGYVLVSSQGNNKFNAYDLKTLAYVGSFSVSGVSATDGIDVTSVSLNGFESGLMVVHNDGDASFKYLKWEDVAARLGAIVDTSWTPRTLIADSPVVTTPPPTGPVACTNNFPSNHPIKNPTTETNCRQCHSSQTCRT